MQVFKTYFLILKKYVGTVVLFFTVFMSLALIMTKAQGSEEAKGFSEVSIDVALIDEDGGTLKKALKDYFGEKVRFRQQKYDKKDITESLYWGDVDYVLVIPEGFEESLQKGKETKELSCMQVPGYFDAVYFETQLQLYMEKMTSLIELGYSVEDAGQEMIKLAEDETQVQIASFVNENQHDTTTRFFLYVPYLFVSVGVLGVAIVLQRLNEKEVKNRTECGPTSLRDRNIEVTAAIIVFGLILYLSVLVIAGILTGGSILTDNRMPWFALNMFAMLLFGISLGFLTGTIAPNLDAINGIVNIASLALCFLGGIFVPQEFFGKGVTMVARFFPTYWYVINNSEIGGMAHVTDAFAKSVLVQTGLVFVYAVVIFSVTLVVISVRRRGQE